MLSVPTFDDYRNFWEYVILHMWYFANMSFCKYGILRICRFAKGVNLSTCNFALHAFSEKCKFANMTLCSFLILRKWQFLKGVNLSMCHFANVTFANVAFGKICQFANVTFGESVNLRTWHSSPDPPPPAALFHHHRYPGTHLAASAARASAWLRGLKAISHGACPRSPPRGRRVTGGVGLLWGNSC